MGEVHRAYDTRLRRQVAIKHLRSELVEDAASVARMLREARSLAQLSHPAIVPIFDLIERDDGVWIVMELVEGPSLAELIGGGALPIPRVLSLARQVTAGLGEAHQKGILHRDLKAENILVAAGDRVRIVDFGLAKPIRGDVAESGISSPGVIVGTFRSMSPEQARGLEIDPRSDLFSFGVLLYEMLTGASPFSGESPADTLARVCGHQPPPVHMRRSDIPPELSALVDRLLHKAPDQRPRSALEVREAIQSFELSSGPPVGSQLEPHDDADSLHEEATATPTRALKPSAEDVAAEEIAAAGARRWRPWLLISLGALLLSALLIFFYFESPGDEAAGPRSDPQELLKRGFDLLDDHDRQESVDMAIELFRRAIDQKRDSALAYAGLARCYVLRYANTGRDPHWLSLALPAARRAVELDSGMAVASASLGLALSALGRFAEAEAELQRALEWAPRDVEVLQALGALYLRQRRFDEAERVLETALKSAPEKTSLWDHLGSLKIATQRFEEAEVAFRHSLEIRPDSVLARRNIAAALYLQGRLTESAGELQKALEIRPEATLYSNLGALLFAQGLYSEAAVTFEKALEMGTLSHSNLSWANLADAYRFIPGQEEDANSAYRRAIQLTAAHLESHPEDHAQRSRLALYWAKSGEPHAAMSEIRQLEVQGPRGPSSLYRLAVALEILGARERALEWLKSALQAGHSIVEVKADPELLELRADPAYHRLIADFESTPRAGSETAADR